LFRRSIPIDSQEQRHTHRHPNLTIRLDLLPYALLVVGQHFGECEA